MRIKIEEEVDVRILRVGEILKETDFYLSTSGSWMPTPIANCPVIDNGVEFVRITEDEWSDSSL